MSSEDTAPAITAAWLYPLFHCLIQCNGTGTTASTSENKGERDNSEASIDEKALPADFVVETVTTKPDKTAIKKAIQAGEDVTGASLVENRNIQIK